MKKVRGIKKLWGIDAMLQLCCGYSILNQAGSEFKQILVNDGGEEL
jgi:hypothetical protein